ncbi:hypothetical protein DFH29DRAFT_985545 [Suillus ampliporus]|nr:hypothetical protein DFH29DRAFT_985545 [Suillus ampliporus]
MSKSKRSKLVSLTKVQQNAEKWKYCWLFEVGAMRNAYLKTVRNLWKDTARIFFSRGAVMAKALGATAEEEHRMGLHKLAQQIKGQVGLFFTDSEPQEVIEWFDDFKQADYARTGNKATRTVILSAGLVMRVHSDPPEPLPHNEDPQLQKLGLTTSMKRGVPTLENPHRVCDKGKALTGEQAQLLKLLGEKMVVWDAASGEVVQVEGGCTEIEREGDEGEDEEMSE